MRRHATLVIPTLVALVASGVLAARAAAHVPPATRTEINGGLTGKKHHLLRVLAHERGAMRHATKSARRLGSVAGDLYWSHYHQAVKTRRHLAAVSRRLAIAVIPYGPWDRLHDCEGVAWNQLGPTYQGGLGIYSGTWSGYGGLRFASNAGYATRVQQIIVARRILAAVGPGAWDGCAPYAARAIGH